MKLTPMSTEVFNYIKENGGRVSIDELCAAIGRSSKSVGANVTDLNKKSLVVREKEENDDGSVTTYAVLTEDGYSFTPDSEE